MGYKSILHKMFGNDETVYNGNVLECSDAKYTHRFPPQDLTTTTGGDAFQSLATNIKNNSVEIDAKKYVIVLNPAQKGQQTIAAYVSAESMAPISEGTQVKVIEETSRFFGISHKELTLVSPDGGLVPVPHWDLIE